MSIRRVFAADLRALAERIEVDDRILVPLSPNIAVPLIKGDFVQRVAEIERFAHTVGADFEDHGEGVRGTWKLDVLNYRVFAYCPEALAHELGTDLERIEEQ